MADGRPLLPAFIPKEIAMKPFTIAIAGFCLFALTTAGRAQSSTSVKPASPDAEATVQSDANRQLIAEIQQLRLELLRQCIEFQQWKLNQIERELHLAQSEQQRLISEERQTQQELNEVSVPITGEGELLKAALTGDHRQKRLAHLQSVDQQVDELSERLRQEEGRLRQLTGLPKVPPGNSVK